MNTQVETDSGLSTNGQSSEERRDQPLDEAFGRATGGAIPSPNVLQHALFPRLLTQDTGLLVPTASGAGRLEAVFVPIMVSREDSSRYGLPRQRLFIIAADDNPLDDYYARLSRYLKALARETGEARTLFIASEAESPVCERCMPDGSVQENVCDHPLDPGVDLAVAPFSHFRSLFFGAGGIHALPQSLLPSPGEADMRPRDLFYFDEALRYSDEDFTAFLRLVEFLFTQDMDLVLGSATLPREHQEALAFLESVVVPEAQQDTEKTLQTVIAAPDQIEETVTRLAAEGSRNVRRAVVCVDDPDLLARVYQRLASEQNPNLYRYTEGMNRDDRLGAYSTILALEQEGEGYLLVTDGPSLASSDFSAELLVTTVCAPEDLIRRAGRVNRRGRQPEARIVVVGDRYPAGARALPDARNSVYWHALAAAASPLAFQSREWKEFIG